MPTLSPDGYEVKPNGLIRGQAATIARIHRVSIAYVLKAANTGKGRPSLLRTIEEYRAKNVAAAQETPPVPAPTA